jgi:hypothetical protein
VKRLRRAAGRKRIISGRKDNMPTHKLSNNLSTNEIAIRIVPKHLRWPPSSTSNAWTKAHHCVDALKHLVRKTEADLKLSAGACEQALKQLLNFGTFDTAEKALMESIEALERLSHRDPKQAQMLQMLIQAREDLGEGVEATKRLIQDLKGRRR